MYSLDLGFIVDAINAAAVHMNPSIKTAMLLLAQPSITPAKNPISNPPTLCKTSIPSVGFGLCNFMALLMTFIFRFKESSFIPVPLPVTSSAL